MKEDQSKETAPDIRNLCTKYLNIFA